jgi:hypothetical protein
MITIKEKGSFKNTEKYLDKLKSQKVFSILNKYGQQGVAVLANATPRDSGLTAESWSYTIVQRPGYYSIRWHNSNEAAGTPVAVLLQYGHGTGTGGYVQGQDYINPAIRPLFDKIAAEAWREVTKL